MRPSQHNHLPKVSLRTASSLTRLNLWILRSHKTQVTVCGDTMTTLGLWPNRGQRVRNAGLSPRTLGLPTLWNSDWSPCGRVVASQKHYPNKCTLWALTEAQLRSRSISLEWSWEAHTPLSQLPGNTVLLAQPSCEWRGPREPAGDTQASSRVGSPLPHREATGAHVSYRLQFCPVLCSGVCSSLQFLQIHIFHSSNFMIYLKTYNH